MLVGVFRKFYSKSQDMLFIWKSLRGVWVGCKLGVARVLESPGRGEERVLARLMRLRYDDCLLVNTRSREGPTKK